MKRLVLPLAILIGLSAVGPAAAASALPPGQLAAIRALIQAEMKKRQIPGATFAIGTGGRLVWSEGFGYADLENNIKAGPETAYRTASIGKSITATGAMELVEQGKLDLDAPVQKYCPRFPPKPWPVTVRHLISHTSGIRHYGGANEQAELFNTRHYDHVSDAVDIFKDDPLQQKPGADFMYTTWGYVLLGCVIEGATHEEFRSYIKHRIFDRADMVSTRDDDPAAIIPGRSRGYILVDGKLQNSRTVDMSSKMAAGGWITTAPDMIRYLDAWMAGRFVGRETRALMLKPFVLPDHGGTVDGYGMGWFLDDYHGMRAGLYGGGTPQVSAIVFMVPEKNLAIAGFFNLEEVPGTERIELAEAIADVVLGYRTPNNSQLTPD